MLKEIVIIPPVVPHVPVVVPAGHGDGGPTDPLAAIAIVVGTVLMIAVLFGLTIAITSPLIDGSSDGDAKARYGLTPSDDHYNGWRRRIYLSAFRRAEARVALTRSRHE